MNKYWYLVGDNAEGCSGGWVKLTEEEANLIAYVSDRSNWNRSYDEPYSGSFGIDLASKCENIPEWWEH